MSEKIQISINDFDLFCELIKSVSRVVESAKLNIDENGLTIFGIHGRISRCEVESNSIFSSKPISFSLLSLGTFTKILQTVKDTHEGDYSDLKFIVNLPFIIFQSKKFKTKLNTCNEDVISKFVGSKIMTTFTPVVEFITTSDLIRRVSSHSYIFDDQTMLRIYLETKEKEDMESNTIFATLGNRSNDLNNEMVLKFGLITLGNTTDQSIIIDLERLQLMNAIQTNEIKMSLMKEGCLVSRSSLKGKNDTFFNLTVLVSNLKS